MLTSENRFLIKAMEMAQRHPHRKNVVSLHAAIIVRGGAIISTGINKPKRNSFVDLHAYHPGCTIHAEVDAILKARKRTDLTGAKIYVARVKKGCGSSGTSKPCPMCQEVIKKYGIKKVYYTSDNDYYETMRM